MLDFWRTLLFGERKRNSFFIEVPYHIVVGAKAIISLQNSIAQTEVDQIDMNYVVRHALQDYIHKYLGDTKEKIKEIKVKRYTDTEIIRDGRKQSMSED